MTHTGSNIKREREKKRMKQCVLAALIEMDQSNLSKIECGKVQISAEDLILVAEALAIPITLLTQKQAPNTTTVIQTDEASKANHSPSLPDLLEHEARKEELNRENLISLAAVMRMQEELRRSRGE